jgi:hypothetical protein
LTSKYISTRTNSCHEAFPDDLLDKTQLPNFNSNLSFGGPTQFLTRFHGLSRRLGASVSPHTLRHPGGGVMRVFSLPRLPVGKPRLVCCPAREGRLPRDQHVWTAPIFLFRVWLMVLDSNSWCYCLRSERCQNHFPVNRRAVWTSWLSRLSSASVL